MTRARTKSGRRKTAADRAYERELRRQEELRRAVVKIVHQELDARVENIIIDRVMADMRFIGVVGQAVARALPQFRLGFRLEGE